MRVFALRRPIVCHVDYVEPAFWLIMLSRQQLRSAREQTTPRCILPFSSSRFGSFSLFPLRLQPRPRTRSSTSTHLKPGHKQHKDPLQDEQEQMHVRPARTR